MRTKQCNQPFSQVAGKKRLDSMEVQLEWWI